MSLQEIDCNACTVPELDFTSPFELRVQNDGKMTAIIGYFDIFFRKDCSQEVQFSTGPASTATHWKQTVFLLEMPIEVKKGKKHVLSAGVRNESLLHLYICVLS